MNKDLGLTCVAVLAGRQRKPRNHCIGGVAAGPAIGTSMSTTKLGASLSPQTDSRTNAQEGKTDGTDANNMSNSHTSTPDTLEHATAGGLSGCSGCSVSGVFVQRPVLLMVGTFLVAAGLGGASMALGGFKIDAESRG